MKATMTSLLLTLTIIIFNSCEYYKEWTGQNELSKGYNYICLVDCSASMPTDMIDWYTKVISNDILSSFQANDKITVLPIDYGSDISSSSIYTLDMSLFKVNTQGVIQTQLEEYRKEQCTRYLQDSILPQFQSIFQSNLNKRNGYNSGTDILGALKQASNYINPADSNIVVILSDMIQETEGVNLERSLKKSTDIPGLVQNTPKLKIGNASIIILTGESARNTTIEKYDLIRNYWHAYADSNALSIVEYNSAITNSLKR